VNRGGKPPHSLTALFFTVVVTTIGYWASKTITPLLCNVQPDFPPGFSTPRPLSYVVKVHSRSTGWAKRRAV
jgi:Zn-dependent protease with chaperone function